MVTLIQYILFPMSSWFIPCYIVPTTTSMRGQGVLSIPTADSSKENAGIQRHLEQAASKTQHSGDRPRQE